jgi:hypothetical protein
LFLLRIFFRGWPNETPRLRLHSLREFLDVAARRAEIVDGGFQFLGGIAKVLERDFNVVVGRKVVADFLDVLE